MSEANKALVHRMVEELQIQHKLDAIDEFFAANFVNHTPPSGVPNTVEGMKQLFSMLFTAFPDSQVTIQDQAAEGDKVLTRKTFTGTHQGEFGGIPPTGKRVSYEVIDILRIANGKITEHWAVVDQLGMLQQLGVIPS